MVRPAKKNGNHSLKSAKSNHNACNFKVCDEDIVKQGLLDRFIEWHIYLLIVLIPLAFWLDTQTIFTLPKLLILRTVSLSAAVFILMKFFRDREVKLVFPGRSLFLGFWLISLILSTIFSINPLTSVFGQYGRYIGIITCINLFLIPIYLATFFPKEKLKKLLGLSVITAVLVGIYGLLQYADFFGLWKPPFEWTDSPQNRVFATMGHANHLAAYLASHFLMLSYCLCLPEKKHEIWLFLGKLLGMVILVWVLILTASRGAILALVGATLLLILLRTWKYRATMRNHIKRIALITVILAAIGGTSYLIFAEKLQDLSLIKRTEQTITSIQKGVVPERISFVYSSWSMFLDHPLLGTGLSTFRDAYSTYRRSDYYIDGPGNAQYITIPESAHDEYVNILATLGLFGSICYLGVLIALYSLLIKQYLNAKTEHENYHLAVLGGVLIFSLQTIFNFGEIVNWFLFALFTGVAFMEDTRFYKLQFRLSNYVAYPLTIILLFGIIWGFKFGVLSEGIADYYYRQANLANARQQYQLADNYFQVATSSKPLEYQLWQSYGDFSINAAVAVAKTSVDNYKSTTEYLKQAVNSYQEAIRLNPHYPSTYHNLALAYLQLNRITGKGEYKTESWKNFQLSVKKSPNNPRYLYEFARKLHTEWNDRQGAVRLLRQALDIAPGYPEPQDYLDFLYKYHPELMNVR